MLHIILFLLKMIGILLLVILGLILLVLALVLLVPIRYRAAVQKMAVTDGDDGKQINNLISVGDTLGDFVSSIRADGKVSWLLGLISLTCGYNGRQAHMDIRLFGRSLLHKKPKKKRQREKKATDRTEKAEVTDRDKQAEEMDLDTKQSAKQSTMAEPEEPVELKGSAEPERRNILESEKIDEENKSDNRFSDIYRRIRGIFTGIAQIPSKIWQKLCSISDAIRHLSEQKERLEATIDRYLDFWHRTCTQAAKDHILKEVKYLLRHILPKKAEGTLTFGFEDPATTGQVLGILCVLSVFTGNHLEVNGNFEGPVLEGDMELKGHIRLCHIAKSAVSLLTDKNIRKTIRDGRKLVGG